MIKFKCYLYKSGSATRQQLKQLDWARFLKLKQSVKAVYDIAIQPEETVANKSRNSKCQINCQ